MGQTWFASNILEPLIIFGFGSEQESNRHCVLTQFFSLQGKLTKAIHMDAFPFIIALSF
jgi:hypothetical protein